VVEMRCQCAHEYNAHMWEVRDEPCLDCECMKFTPATQAFRLQLSRLWAATCPAGRDRHLLVKVSTRRWRDWFRARVWWKCWNCDLEEEIKA
jgi:hypothetical protein